MTPRVSVVIPYYNAAALVRETLDSVLAQTYRDFELILVNDGSPDTLELEGILQPYLDKIVYVHKENGGVSSARNRGIALAQGELIALLDADDLWTPEYLAFQVAQLDADPSAHIVYPNAVYFGTGENGDRLAMNSGAPMPEVTFTSLVNGDCSVVVSILARKTALERAGLFDEKFSYSEDFDLWLRCVKTDSRIIYHHEVLLRHRVLPGSLSWDMARMAAHAANVLRKMQATVPLTSDESAAVERHIARFDGEHFFYEGKKAFFAGEYAAAIDNLKESSRLLHRGRITLLLLLLRTAPGLARSVHARLYPDRLQ